MTGLGLLLIALAVAFAFSLGAHYTGACMGMPVAARALSLRSALVVMAPLSLVGAAVASGRVEGTVGHGILGGAPVSIGLAVGIIASAFALTTLYNFARLPTSTIQILVFSIVGAALATGRGILWGTIDALLVVWVAAPFAAFGLGFLFIRFWDRVRAPPSPGRGLPASVATALVLVGGAASFAMGANDVSNAGGALIMTELFSLPVAGLIGGVGIAIGVLTWGRPLLTRAAFQLVRLDGRMATAAQLGQAVVILVSVAFGYFTSMNQALVGSMLGVGLSRDRRTIEWDTIRGVLLGWAAGPISGAALGFLVCRLLAGAGYA